MPVTVSPVTADCSVVRGRVIINVLSTVEAPPACHRPLLGLKNHTHLLGF